MPIVTPVPNGVRVSVQVQPRAGRTELAGILGEAVKIRLTAPPVDGAANDALLRFLSESLGVPRAAVAIVRGHSARRKTVEVSGIGVQEARRRLHIAEG